MVVACITRPAAAILPMMSAVSLMSPDSEIRLYALARPSEHVPLTAGTIVTGQLVALRPVLASATWIEKEPVPVGVPVRVPVDGLSVSPGVSVPTSEYVYGVVPPETDIGTALN